ILMSESLVGVSVAATRQNGGRSLNGFAAAPSARPLAPRPCSTPPAGVGTVKAPAATVCAAVIVACCSESAFRFSQVAAEDVSADPRTATVKAQLAIKNLALRIKNS